MTLPTFGPNARAHIELRVKNRVVESEQTLQPSKRWTIYFVPHVHLDIGYTDYQAKVAAVQSRIIDEALDLFALHPDFRFSLDGMWSFDQFLANRTDADKARAFAALKSRKLSVPAQYSNESTGFASAESLIRSLYPSAQMDFHHNLPLNYANITDVPSYSWSYASILASAGIHELVAGSNNGRALSCCEGIWMRNRRSGGKDRMERKFCSGTPAIITRCGCSSGCLRS